MSDLLEGGGEKRTLLFITGTRADFGKLKPLMTRAQADPQLNSRIFVTGMHLLERYGYTLDEIEKAGFTSLYTYINQTEAFSSQMDLVLANTIQGLGAYVHTSRPDLIVVHGDRVEALAGAIVGALNNVLVAHIEGGELSGTIDELIRHSVSKLSHLHFVANDEAKTRLCQMGEVPESISVIGSPDIDIMLSDKLPSLDEARNRYAIPFEHYCLFLYHPVTTELGELRENIGGNLEALRDSGRQFVVIYPNNDSGSATILEALSQLEGDEKFRVLPSLRFEHFLTVLKFADAIVGNSSAGIREAPVYGVPTLNIGTRQLNRSSAPSIHNIPDGRKNLLGVLSELPSRAEPSFHFGEGRSAELFMDALGRQALWETPRQKQFRDLDVPSLAER
jgi:UDP-N-acetylglucosamine 2-epimerase (hydrolysing)